MLKFSSIYDSFMGYVKLIMLYEFEYEQKDQNLLSKTVILFWNK